ncbi:Ran-binding-domain-containing protein, partial [Suhomyces tanzawaensis NRRL Y-17324]
MDQILAKASNQAVTFAIRSGISLASGYAIKTITRLLDKLPEEEKQRIQKGRNRLQTKIDVVSVSIDLIRLASARGNTTLESTLSMIQELTEDIDHFQERIDGIANQLTGVNAKESVKRVEDQLRKLENQINDLVPLLNLSLITAGVNMNGSLGKGISPGRLLQASNYLINSENNSEVGPTFDLVMYTIFYNPSRLKSVEGADELSCITWKETYARALVKITKLENNNFDFKFEIHEDLNDGRYHEEEATSKIYDVSKIERMFFSASGKLLKLEGRNSPVLIIKLVEGINEEWIGLGELNAGEFDEEDDDEEDEDENDDEDERDGNKAKKESKAAKNTSLSLLEYLLRLSKLQQIEQQSILNIKDEVLALYLKDEEASNLPIVPQTSQEK